MQAEVLGGLRQVMSIDAAFFATVDPATILFTSVIAEAPLGAATPLFLENEFGHDDVNKFTALASAGDPVRSLDQATAGDRSTSDRYLDVMAPMNLGDELRPRSCRRVVAGECCASTAPTARPASARRTSRSSARSPLTSQRACGAPLVVSGVVPSRPGRVGPGSSSSTTTWRSRRSTTRRSDGWPSSSIPHGSTSATARSRRRCSPLRRLSRELSKAAAAAPSAIRLRAVDGQWLTLHASVSVRSAARRPLSSSSRRAPADVASIYLDAVGLTPRRRGVASLVLLGRSTQQIVTELHISSHTVQEHLRAVFDKLGVASRRELVATLLGDGH